MKTTKIVLYSCVIVLITIGAYLTFTGKEVDFYSTEEEPWIHSKYGGYFPLILALVIIFVILYINKKNK